MKKKLFLILASILTVMIFISSGCKHKNKNTVKVGLLHSLTGTMAISEKPVLNAELLAIKEINNKGGVLGNIIVPVIKDGESDPDVFNEHAEELLTSEKVATVFGCWTSASRTAVKKTFEKNFGLLWYPVQYEGLEASPNIMYMGAAPNQQVIPAVKYCSQTFGKRMYLIGNDYVFPHTANKMIKALLNYTGGKCCGEVYVPMDASNFTSIIKDIKRSHPDVILNTLNGDSNVHFFQQMIKAGLTADIIPTMSFSISENEIEKIGIDNLKGQYVTWNYYQSTDTPENKKFVSAYKEEYGSENVTGDPVEAAYIAVYMWAAACEKAKTFDVESVRIAAKGLSFKAPEGTVTIDGNNQHLNKTVRIGQINDDGQINEIWTTEGPVRPDPYLSTYEWALGL